jgi:hypothetical protein
MSPALSFKHTLSPKICIPGILSPTVRIPSICCISYSLYTKNMLSPTTCIPSIVTKHLHQRYPQILCGTKYSSNLKLKIGNVPVFEKGITQTGVEYVTASDFKDRKKIILRKFTGWISLLVEVMLHLFLHSCWKFLNPVTFVPALTVLEASCTPRKFWTPMIDQNRPSGRGISVKLP